MGIVSLTIGKLNLISVTFAVLFIGLTVDYGIQIDKNFRKKEDEK